MNPEPRINWQYPPPRPGWRGQLDTFFGPGTTRAEIWLEVGSGLAAAVALVIYAAANALDWSLVQYVVAALLAEDLVGGVATNAASSGKRWYHRAGQGFRQHMLFIVIHAVQPALVVLFFRPGDWGFFALVYGYLLLAAALILRSPLYLQRPLALLALCGGFLITFYGLSPTPGLEWFIPVYYVKLLVSHALREEPYRPPNEDMP
ncbi:MAG: hypothetical protein HXY40_03325 [Chloroflexi bacterium]|nr:hypothetical protein [Chloroflexota bacterium]